MVTLSSVAEILNGDRSANYPSGNDFVSFGFPFINAGHLKNGKIDFSTMDYISEDKYRQLSGAKIRKNDILLCLRGSLGKYAVSNINEGAPASSIAVIRPNERVINSKFLTCVISSFIFQKQIDLANNGSSQPNLSASSVSDFLIPIPSLDEQELIAEALLDVDSMISSLEKLIAKKKAIKQGAMQELLTGKKRLPGFTREWTNTQLKQIYETITTGKLDANAACVNGKYRFYTCAKDFSYIDNYAFAGEALLISGNGENVGYIHHYIGKFNAYQRTYVLMGFKCNVSFLKQYLNYFLPLRILLEVAKSNTPYIKKETISDMEINLPNIEEQEAIASVLSDMDNEIEALEQKLAKARQIKQGMMQQLLTGKIRLV